MLNASKIAIKSALGLDFPMLERVLVEFENAEKMRAELGWFNEPRLDGVLLRDLADDPFGDSAGDPHWEGLGNSVELDFRLLRDTEVLCGMTANLAAAKAYEIGKSFVEAACDADHSAQSVYDETRAALRVALPGDFIVWQEFNLDLVPDHPFIREVCLGIEELYRTRLLQGNLYHLRDSWVGLYRVP